MGSPDENGPAIAPETDRIRACACECSFSDSSRRSLAAAEDDAEVAEGARLEDLFASYGRRYPELAGFRHSVVASVNQSFADWASPLATGDEVAFLPPVSGGAGVSAVAPREAVIELVRDPIRVAEISCRLKAPEDGAVVVFRRNCAQ